MIALEQHLSDEVGLMFKELLVGARLYRLRFILVELHGPLSREPH